MDFNFFEWIRQGVKRSVLMGVSDAVTQMGAPHTDEDSRDKIMAFLQDESPKTVTSRRRLSSSAPAEPGQRKLGRSIADLHPSEAGNQ